MDSKTAIMTEASPEEETAKRRLRLARLTGRGGVEDETESASAKKKLNWKPLIRTGAMVLGLSLALSAVAFFVLDLAGWRSGMRDTLTDMLIGKEKQVIEAEIALAFEGRVAAAVEEALAEERAALLAERQALDLREQELDSRESSIAQKEREVAQALAEAAARRRQADELAAKAEGKLNDIAALCALYEAMEPENAASIMEKIDDVRTLAAILSNMENQRAAAILEVMESAKAADILNRIGS
ncbi:MAG: magnesium transporter MgtE N-terminal domain-containing protein [Christensenellales bacterium]|jgi:flagellar motility protein MotE (MotC chaperone)